MPKPFTDPNGRMATGLFPDTQIGGGTSGTYTVNTTASISIPDTCLVIRMRPADNIRYRIGSSGQTPAADPASGTLANGMTAYGNEWETIVPECDTPSRKLNLLSSASTAVYVEFR